MSPCARCVNCSLVRAVGAAPGDQKRDPEGWAPLLRPVAAAPRAHVYTLGNRYWILEEH